MFIINSELRPSLSSSTIFCIIYLQQAQGRVDKKNLRRIWVSGFYVITHIPNMVTACPSTTTHILKIAKTMSSTFRSLSRHTRMLSQRTKPTATLHVRFFHSPFVVLNSLGPATPPPLGQLIYVSLESQTYISRDLQRYLSQASSASSC